MSFFRIASALALAGTCACATDTASRAEVSELQGELQSMRMRTNRLERRVEMLESEQAVQRAAQAQDAGDGHELDIPPLTVIKLKPRSEPAPRLDTHKRVREPEPAVVDALGAAPPADADDAQPQDPLILEAEYNRDLESLRTGDVVGGSAKLEAFANAHPKSPLADNALYYCGVGLMGLDDCPGATERFERVLRDYPAGDVVADSMLKLAECRARMKQPAAARSLYAQLAHDYPGTPAADQAQERLATLKGANRP